MMKKKSLLTLISCCLLMGIHAKEMSQYECFSLMKGKIKPSVAPMLKTTWGQNAPYNLQCPLAPGKNVHCKTGCVATAMAQVMKYYGYPARGQGNVSYAYKGGDGLTHIVETDFSKSTYDWEKMKDAYTYGDNSSEEEKQAVAKLMADCGAAVKMDYGQDYSGAYDMDVAQALKVHFAYDEAVTYLSTFLNEVNDSTWYTTLYQQLSDGMPVIYGGSSPYAQHCFVIDGYDEKGNFHVVYGLGDGDGFVNLKKISYQNQSMTFNIKPRKVSNAVDKHLADSRTPKEKARYRLDGTRISRPQLGINIIVMDDGTVRKEIITAP
ncbi:C10 family peptidase [Hoylesella buccalis]|nr:C10 family peptidase [Hoylesella buccalis]